MQLHTGNNSRNQTIKPTNNMAIPKKASAKALPITDKRSKAYKESQKKLVLKTFKVSPEVTEVHMMVPVEKEETATGKKYAPSHNQMIQDLQNSNDNLNCRITELVERIEKLESIVG